MRPLKPLLMCLCGAYKREMYVHEKEQPQSWLLNEKRNQRQLTIFNGALQVCSSSVVSCLSGPVQTSVASFMVDKMSGLRRDQKLPYLENDTRQ